MAYNKMDEVKTENERLLIYKKEITNHIETMSFMESAMLKTKEAYMRKVRVKKKKKK